MTDPETLEAQQRRDVYLEKLRERIQYMGNKNSQYRELAETVHASGEEEASAHVRELQQLDVWKHEWQYKQSNNVDDLKKAREKYRLEIRQDQNEPQLNQEIFNLIVRGSPSTVLDTSGNSDEVISVSQTKKDTYQGHRTVNSFALASEQSALNHSNGHTKSRFSFRSYLANEQNRIQAQGGAIMTQHYHLKSLNRELLNKMLLQRLEKQLQNRKNSAKQGQAASQEVLRGETEHFQKNVLQNFKSIVSYFQRPARALDTQILYPKLRSYAQTPQGLQATAVLHAQKDDDTQNTQESNNAASLNKQHESEEENKNEEKLLLDDYVESCSQLSSHAAQIMRLKKRSLDLQANLVQARKDLLMLQRKSRDELDQLQKQREQQLQAQKKVIERYTTGAESQLKIDKFIKESEAAEAAAKRRKENIEKQLQSNGEQIVALEAETKSLKERKGLTRAALGDLYIKMLRSTSFGQESLIWIIKALLRIQNDVRQQYAIFPEYLDSQSIEFLINYAKIDANYDQLRAHHDENGKRLRDMSSNTGNNDHSQQKSIFLNSNAEGTSHSNAAPARQKLEQLVKNCSQIVRRPVLHLATQSKSTEVLPQFECDETITQNEQVFEGTVSDTRVVRLAVGSKMALSSVDEEWLQLQNSGVVTGGGGRNVATAQARLHLTPQQKHLIEEQQQLRTKMIALQEEMARLKQNEIERLFELYLPSHLNERLLQLKSTLFAMFGSNEGEYQYRMFLKRRLTLSETKDKNRTFFFAQRNNVLKHADFSEAEASQQRQIIKNNLTIGEMQNLNLKSKRKSVASTQLQQMFVQSNKDQVLKKQDNIQQQGSKFLHARYKSQISNVLNNNQQQQDKLLQNSYVSVADVILGSSSLSKRRVATKE